MQVVSIGSRPVFGYEAITVDNTAGGKSFTAAKYIKGVSDNNACDVLVARSALVTVEGDQIRVIFDGTTTVTSSEGHLFNVGDSFIVDGPQTIKNARFIRVTANATIRVTYFG